MKSQSNCIWYVYTVQYKQDAWKNVLCKQLLLDCNDSYTLTVKWNKWAYFAHILHTFVKHDSNFVKRKKYSVAYFDDETTIGWWWIFAKNPIKMCTECKQNCFDIELVTATV